MKIKPSLRVYFLIVMIITGITTISIMSVVSFNYFINGLDFSIRKEMRTQAYQLPVSEGKPVKLNNFIIASTFNDLPESIKSKIDEKKMEVGELVKSVEGNLLFAPPKAGYFAMKLERNGEIRFAATSFFSDVDRPYTDKLFPPFKYLVMIAFTAMALFALVPYFILRKVTKPIENLMAWAKQLNKQQLTKPAPDFHYSELNSLAEIVKSSLQSVQAGLEREQQFLGYASHELRTPIAITRTNTELLRKMIEKEISTEKQLQVLDRIERASLNMTNLTETLLWLNRQADKSIPLSTVSLGQLTEQLFNELQYLLNDKKVDIQIKTDQTQHQLPAVLCRIIINNLIRNALQHTNEGKIVITQSSHQLIIHNQEVSENMVENDLGFGLGLELIERLVNHYEWQYKNIATDNGHYVEINFA
ncbi:HAMP domain-containing sensor histidine kinase [Psychromonas sp. 14N.309.X.WAT.B.A12]|uniref:sensor histidine kinase n=1 Tax=unclassified Psychromonas TaxID=2614957 RepID=UPI0025B0CF55|nr:HAMP domain-containing sensor histidine kinase [Psychromonas sp. 14N.309.X.WAT.B.A12]MDN2663310.1 HAMP domain-containing sensor histidine kinase [Psychromonas sp. 14N.309.X.WAT.B.A12]